MRVIKIALVTLALVIALAIGHVKISSTPPPDQYCDTWNGDYCDGQPTNCMCPIIIEPK